MSDTLAELVASSLERIKELRAAGEPGVLLAAAVAATNAIELRAGDGQTDADRQALMAVKRFTYNVAADCWPGWSLPAEPADPRNLVAALGLAQRSLSLVRKLELGLIQEGTGLWLVGAFELALDNDIEAFRSFTDARRQWLAAPAPGLALLAEGYIAIVQGGGELEAVCAKIAAGGFEDGAEWIEQLRTALKVFMN